MHTTYEVYDLCEKWILQWAPIDHWLQELPHSDHYDEVDGYATGTA